jgi:hypothetical protein
VRTEQEKRWHQADRCRQFTTSSGCQGSLQSSYDKDGSWLLPVQLDFGVPRATEAAAHAARSYIAGLQTRQGLLKLDFGNAFNKVCRDNMFQTTHDELTELYPFVHMWYASAYLLNFGDHLLLSDKGVQ